MTALRSPGACAREAPDSSSAPVNSAGRQRRLVFKLSLRPRRVAGATLRYWRRGRDSGQTLGPPDARHRGVRPVNHRFRGSWAVAVAVACSAAYAAKPLADVTINDTNVYPESISSTADGTLFAGSVKGIIYRATPGSSQAD